MRSVTNINVFFPIKFRQPKAEMLQREDSESSFKTKVETSSISSLPTETQMMGMLMLSNSQDSVGTKHQQFLQRFDEKNQMILPNLSRPLWRGEDGVLSTTNRGQVPLKSEGKAVPGARRNSVADNGTTTSHIENKSVNGHPAKYKSHSTKRWICDHCGKVYKHPNCLSKHKWEHTDAWKETNKLSISKHQQVQLLEAASVLIGFSNPLSKEFVPSTETRRTATVSSSLTTYGTMSTSSSMEYRSGEYMEEGIEEEDVRSDEDSVGSQPRVFGMEL